ncbi:MAG: PQQ-binding-like beta-propeller repeat protein [Vicinamibacterales bacterium]
MSRGLIQMMAVCGLVAGGLAVAVVTPRGQVAPKAGEWRGWGNDLGSTRYSALDQITAANFDKLEIAWRFKTDHLGPRPEFQYEGTPIMVNGVMYTTGGSRRAVVALDPVTGEELWVHSEREPGRANNSPRQLSGRGLSYWTDGREERIYYVTTGYQLVALDAKTGMRIASFGKGGMVDLKLENDQIIDPNGGDIGLHATPLVTKNVVVVGAAFGTGANPKSARAVKGNIRGFDVRTGKRLWIFHTIPQPGEFGNDTWEKDSWSYTGNTGSWAQLSADEDLGLAYIPVESPTGDYYGANRPGNNLFGETLVALDLQTGRRKWHFQFVHHPIWDMDLPCAPILVDVPMNGRTIKAIAQPSKQGYLYVLNRETGEPVWPIVERPVPAGTVPGEWYSPTQPFPTRPPAYERQSVSIDDLIDYTPELRAEAVEIAKKYTMGGLVNPPVVSNKIEDRLVRSRAHRPLRTGRGSTRVARGVRLVDRQHRHVWPRAAPARLLRGCNPSSGNAVTARLPAGQGRPPAEARRTWRHSAVPSPAAPQPAPARAAGGEGGGGRAAAPTCVASPISEAANAWQPSTSRRARSSGASRRNREQHPEQPGPEGADQISQPGPTRDG